MKKKLISIFKQDTVLCIALLLAVLSACIVLPDSAYLDYIDWRTLAILLCLMTVMAGLQALGLFRLIAETMLIHVKSRRSLVLILTLLCFFSSMLITNDVALITFVPFTFTVLHLLDEKTAHRLVIPVIVLQTIAANLGSMLTPIGNPQNLYLYGKSGLSMPAFLQLMLPYTVLSLVLLLISCLWIGRKKAHGTAAADTISVQFPTRTGLTGKAPLLITYLILFALCLLTVAHIIPYPAMLLVVLTVVLIMDRTVLTQVDYALLLTFIGFFVFIGNMGRIPVFCSFLEGIITGREVLTAVVSSQVISNVPAALLLSGFTTDIPALIVGTNLGGLGTLIASMASLISYKAVVKEEPNRKGAYFLWFSAANVLFLAILMLFYVLI